MNSAQPSQSAPPERQVWFEPLTLADLDVVWDTETQAYTHPWTLGNFRDSLQSGYPAQMLVTPVLPGDAPTLRTASGHMLLGYWVAMQVLDEVHLLNIAVAPAHRRQGWAQAMLHGLVASALTNQAQWLWLEVRTSNTPAQALYQGFGFQRMGVRKQYYPAGNGQREDALVMSLNLHARAPMPVASAPGSAD